MWECGSIMAAGTPAQAPTCRVRELEAELAGVKGLLVACRNFVQDRLDYAAGKRRKKRQTLTERSVLVDRLNQTEQELIAAYVEYAKSKEESDEPAS